MIRQDLTDQICPLDQADPISVKAVLISDLIHLGNISDPIYIKMIERQPSFFIALQNGKGRTVHRFHNAKPCCQPLCKHSFSNPKVTDQCIHLSRSSLFSDLFPKGIGILCLEAFFFCQHLIFTFFGGIWVDMTPITAAVFSPMAFFGRIVALTAEV